MDDFRVGGVPPSELMGPHRIDDAAGRRRRRHAETPADAEEDIVELSEQTADEDESSLAYGPRRE